MSALSCNLARGALAGAAGTTTLNAATSVDMALRGRGTSSAPPQTVEAVADQAGVEIAGDEESLPHAAYRLVSAAADDVTRASPA